MVGIQLETISEKDSTAKAQSIGDKIEEEFNGKGKGGGHKNKIKERFNGKGRRYSFWIISCSQNNTFVLTITKENKYNIQQPKLEWYIVFKYFQ